jgi:hypothetical protein
LKYCAQSEEETKTPRKNKNTEEGEKVGERTHRIIVVPAQAVSCATSTKRYAKRK